MSIAADSTVHPALRVAVVGAGYWGPNLARNINAHEGCELVRVADMLEKRRKIVQKNYPAVDVVDDPSLVTKAADIDLVVVATPVFTHYGFAKEALLNGKHVWVEKPMTSNSEQARELVELAQKRSPVFDIVTNKVPVTVSLENGAK